MTNEGENKANDPESDYKKGIRIFNSFEEMNEYDHRYYASLTPSESLAQVTLLRLSRYPYLNTNLNPWGTKNIYQFIMDILTAAHQLFLLDLSKAGVEFILIGGYAVNYYGYTRYTADLDIWLKPDEKNKIKFIEFLVQQKFSEEGIYQLQKLNFANALSFHIGEHETRIDFLTLINGVSYDEADKQKVWLSLREVQIPVIHYNHLIVNKMSSNRSKDKADVDELQKINQYRTKK